MTCRGRCLTSQIKYEKRRRKHDDCNPMHPSRRDLPADARERMVVLLNQQLADTTDLYSQTKQAHWNVKGPGFYQLHELFDGLAESVEGLIDLIAEHVTALGGEARGTVRLAAEASRLPEYPTDLQRGLQHVESLAERWYAQYAASTRKGIDVAAQAGDAGFEGDAFVALFGDLAPVTTPRQMTPAGFKVVRVDMRRREVVDFAVNKIAGPASKLPHEGFERPSHCAFGPDGALFVVDWGEIEIAPERSGVRTQQGTGTLWRIRRTQEPQGVRPPASRLVPLYGLPPLLGGVVGAIGLAALLRWPIRRMRR